MDEYTKIRRFYAWVGFSFLAIVTLSVAVWVLHRAVCW